MSSPKRPLKQVPVFSARGPTRRSSHRELPSAVLSHMRTHISRYLLFGIGIAGIVISVASGLLRAGRPVFGMTQTAGLVISTFLALQSMQGIAFPKIRVRVGFLLLVYLFGVLFMGLRPLQYELAATRHFLVSAYLPRRDFIINIVGFIPFGYLIVLYLASSKCRGGLLGSSLLAVVSGTGTSLLLEIAQFYIPGRTSSLYDLIANGMGTCFGVAYFLVEKKFSSR
jgi:VanZ family protein